MGRNDWDRDWGYGGDFQQNRGWTGGWSGRDRDDWDRDSRWMNQRVGWSSNSRYGGDYTGGGWQGGDREGGWNRGRYQGGSGRGRWSQQGSWGGGWAGTEPGARRRTWSGWSGPPVSRGNGWGWNRATMGPGGWREAGMTRPAGYGAAFQGPGYGREYMGRPRGSRRRDYGRWGGYGGERMPGRGPYYSGEYGW